MWPVRSLILLGLVVGMSLVGAATSPRPYSAAALAAPANLSIGELSFSEQVTGNAEPKRRQTDFQAGTEAVWVSFEYQDNGGEKVSYLARANDQDYRFGKLDCCDGKKGRFAFPIVRRNGGDLPGAAYDVFIYVNDQEAARGGFGVEGTQGLDSDNDNNGGNGNDN